MYLLPWRNEVVQQIMLKTTPCMENPIQVSSFKNILLLVSFVFQLDEDSG